MINSHKEAVISDECKAVSLYRKGFSRDKIFEKIIEKDKRWVKSGCLSFGYRYPVGHYQGNSDNAILIGDKHCGPDTGVFGDKEVLSGFMKCIDLPFKFIWVTREKYTQIKSMQNMLLRVKKKEYEDINKVIEVWERQRLISEEICQNHEVYIINIEEFLSDFDNEGRKLFEYLELEHDKLHLELCKKIIK